MNIISRDSAIALGLTRFFTGVPCKRVGHICERRTGNGGCCECGKLNFKKYAAANAELCRATKTKWRHDNPGQRKVQRTRYYAKPGRKRRKKWLARGLPAPTRPEPVYCEICGKKDPLGRALALDHCHETGTFRGWLCWKCNVSLGHLGDNLISLRQAVAYLERALE